MYRLIIIDDEKAIVDGIAEIFPWDHIGFSCVGKFTDARMALSYIEKSPVDVILTDISMPNMDGIEFTKKVREHSNTVIVFISSYRQYDYMRAAILQEVSDYLLKPVRYEELITCFEKIKDRLDRQTQKKVKLTKNYYQEITDRVTNYIEQHYQTATLNSAAECVGLSPNYLSKLYKEKTNIGFLDKLNQIRMEKSCELLNDVKYKSYEIAFLVGYDNPKNFARAFKAYYQISPRDYRNGVRGGKTKC